MYLDVIEKVKELISIRKSVSSEVPKIILLDDKFIFQYTNLSITIE